MKHLAVVALAVVALVVGSAPASEASAAKPKVRVTGWTLQTSDHTDDDALQVPNGGSYTMGCDTILEITADVTAKHVKKGSAYSWRTTYSGATQYSYAQAWTRSGKVVTTYFAMKTPSQTGTLAFTMKAKHKVIAKGSLHITLSGCHAA